MGLSAFGALIFLALALIAQSPRLLQSIRLSRLRLDLRVRAFTSFAFALLLLAMAFFLAGVPLNPGREEVSGTTEGLTNQPQSESSPAVASLDQLPTATVRSEAPISSAPITPETGAFGGPPVTEEENQPSISSSPVITATPILESTAAIVASNTPAPSQTPVPTEANTAEPTESPTTTPSPSLTPTSISGQTAVINTGGSNIWLSRSPGGQNLVIIRHGDIAILLPRHANQAGQLWREIQTINGVTGWILDEFLQTPE